MLKQKSFFPFVFNLWRDYHFMCATLTQVQKVPAHPLSRVQVSK